MTDFYGVGQNPVEGVYESNYKDLKSNSILAWIFSASVVVVIVAVFYSGWILGELPDYAAVFCLIWFSISFLCSVWVQARFFVPGYLLTLIAYLVGWRIAALNESWLVMWLASVGGAFLAVQLIGCIIQDYRRGTVTGSCWFGNILWQFTLIRMTFGLNEICHSVEKLFAGAKSFDHMVLAFRELGLTQGTEWFVIAGGLVELFLAVSVGLGFFARLGALIGLLYFLIATVGFGGEWTRGYAWASPGGGGWEYVMLIMMVFVSVMVVGAGKFSIDGWMLKHRWIPDWAVRFCTNKAGQAGLPAR